MPWRPQLGFQSLALSTKLFVDELFMGGDRGGGKSSTLLADYAQDVKIGDKWKGIIFRKTADEFETLIERSKEMFYDMFGKKAVYLQDAMTWKFPGGATLQFHHMHRDGDADKFVGREYCIAKGTLIKRADHSLCPIENIKVGDSILTLQGPQPVFKLFAPKLKPCVLAEIFDTQGNLLGQQVHSVSHPILSTSGWKSYASILETCAKEFEGSFRDVLRPLAVTFPVVLHKPSLPLNHFCEHQHSTIQSLNLCKHFARYDNKPSRFLQLAFENTKDQQQIFLSEFENQGYSELRFVSCGDEDAICCFQKVQGSQSDYPFYRRLCGGQLLLGEECVLNGVPLQGDAGEPSPIPCGNMDGEDCIPEYNRLFEGWKYNHPYTGVQVQSQENIVFGACRLSPCGWKWTYDLSVSNIAHYITSCNLINRNCWVGWDEIPQFPNPKPYLKMLASIRTSGKNIPSRVRSTGNPGGAGIGWVKQRFQIDERRVEECDGQLITDPRTGLTRMFLLSLYKENKIHQHLDPNYRNRLLAATEGDPELERAWVHADFSALFGQYFKLFDDTIHKVDPQEILHPYGGKIPAHWRLEAGLDYGDGASPTSFILYATTPENISYAIAEYYDFGEYPSFHASACEALYRGCPYTRGRKPSRVWADTQIFYTRTAANQGQMNKRVSDVFRREAGLNVVPSNKDRMAGWRHVKELIAWRKDGDGKFIRTPQFYYFPECVNLEREFKDAVHSETGNRHDIDKGCSDHALDQLRYWAMGARKATQLDTEEKRKAIAEKSSDTFAGMMRQNKLAKMGMAHHYAPFVDLEKTPADIDRQLLEMLEEQSEPELVA